MDLHKINKIRTLEDNSNSQFKLNMDTKRTLKNLQSLEIKFREKVTATPRTTTGVKSKSNFGIEENDRTEVSKDSGFVQLAAFDDGSKTNETPFPQQSKKLKLNKSRLSIKRKRKELDKSVINNEESCDGPEKISIDEQIETPLIKRRRKHSAKVNNLTEADLCITETEENTRNSTFTVREDIQVNPTSDATPYKKLEKIRKDIAARNLFKQKPSSRKSIPFNLVDKLNAVVDKDPKIVLVDVKRVNKTDVYDFTSSSEAENFKKKKIVTRSVKRVNKSDVYDVASSAETDKDFKKKEVDTRSVKRVNKSDVYDVTSRFETDKDFKKKEVGTRSVKSVNKSDVYDVTSSAGNGFAKKKIATFTEKKTPRLRSKVSERTRSKSKMQSKMVDEWMRKAEPIYLNTSIAQELSGQKTVIDTEVEPIHNKPRVFISPDHVDSGKATIPATKTLKWNKKRSEERKRKQDDHICNELEIETIPAFTKRTHSILDLDKLDNICDDHLHKSDLIPNLLHESEQLNDNCTLTKVNIASNRSQRKSSDISQKELVVLDELDEKSISTAGINPITAHGVDDESPPKIDDITRTISATTLEAEGLSEKAREYYHQLLEDTDQSESRECSRSCDKSKKDKTLCLSVTRLPQLELRRYSREPHEVKSVDPSASPYFNRQELSAAETLRSNLNPSDGESSNRKPIMKPMTRIKENADCKIGYTDSLASKPLTFERVKENHPSTSKPRQDASAEHRSVASSVYDWFQRNESAKPRTADDLNELVDMIISKIESTLPEILKNTNARLVQLVETLIAEFMDQASDILRRGEQAAAESFQQLIQEIQALKPDTRNL